MHLFSSLQDSKKIYILNLFILPYQWAKKERNTTSVVVVKSTLRDNTKPNLCTLVILRHKLYKTEMDKMVLRFIVCILDFVLLSASMFTIRRMQRSKQKKKTIRTAQMACNLCKYASEIFEAMRFHPEIILYRPTKAEQRVRNSYALAIATAICSK